MTRDSKLFYLLLLAAIVGYLKTVPTAPNVWSYQEWLNALIFLSAWLIGKMQHSPLPGEHDKETVSPR